MFHQKLFFCLFVIFFIKNSNSTDLNKGLTNLIPDVQFKGLWFYDDEGNLVKAEITIPALIDYPENVDSKVFYTMHTRTSPGGKPFFLNDEASLRSTDFDPSKKTFIITHGWQNSKKSDACVLPKDAYLQHDDYNVVIVDWSIISKSLNYGYSASYTKNVGKSVARMIDFLVSQGMNPDTLTIVGHSLGGHVAGLAGYYAKSIVNYVIALDPALPLFVTAGIENSLSTKDARHVEVLHTNGGVLGLLNPVGHVDFFLNGGSVQSGCIGSIMPVNTCSHLRAYRYLAESINSQVGFHGNKCSSQFQILKGCNGPSYRMGGVRDKIEDNVKGSYFVITESKEPFARGVPTL